MRSPAGRVFAVAVVAIACVACSGTAPSSASTGSVSIGSTPEEPSPSEGPASAGSSPTAGSGDGSAPLLPTAVTRTAVPDDPVAADGTVIADRLDVPWGVDFFPDGDALVSERDTATLLRISQDGAVTELAVVAGVTPTAEGGLLGVAVSPDYATDHLIYVYSTTADDNRVRRGTLDDFREGQDSVILDGIPRGEIHDGGRIEFGPDGRLYVSTGETGNPDLSQDKDSLGGKILRINPNGSIPDDNPIAGSPVWTYGHRNVQGLTWDANGRMWASEFGASSWDEINQILPGRNYGWPNAEGTSDTTGFADPAAVFSTSSASPSGLAYADGYLWMGALQGATVWRLTITDNGQLADPVAITVAPARTRSIVLAPDGRLWVTTSNTDGRGQPRDDQDKIIAIRP